MSEFLTWILVLLGVIAMIGFILYRTRKHKEVNDQIFEDSIDQVFSITTPILEEYGFNIHDTKDQLYALHPTGPSMTWIQGSEWAVKIIDSGDVWHDKIYTMTELVQFCGKHNHPIKKQEDSNDTGS